MDANNLKKEIIESQLYKDCIRFTELPLSKADLANIIISLLSSSFALTTNLFSDGFMSKMMNAAMIGKYYRCLGELLEENLQLPVKEVMQQRYEAFRDEVKDDIESATFTDPLEEMYMKTEILPMINHDIEEGKKEETKEDPNNNISND